MKLAELIAKVEQTRPSSYDKNDLTQWVNEIEYQAIEQVFSRCEQRVLSLPCEFCDKKDSCDNKPTLEEFKGYQYDLDADAELMIPNQFIGTYTSYLYAKIDFNNAELDRYQMDLAMHEAEWQAFASWFRRNHRPRRNYRNETPVYYKYDSKTDVNCKYVQRIEPEHNNN